MELIGGTECNDMGTKELSANEMKEQNNNEKKHINGNLLGRAIHENSQCNSKGDDEDTLEAGSCNSDLMFDETGEEQQISDYIHGEGSIQGFTMDKDEKDAIKDRRLCISHSQRCGSANLSDDDKDKQATGMVKQKANDEEHQNIRHCDGKRREASSTNEGGHDVEAEDTNRNSRTDDNSRSNSSNSRNSNNSSSSSTSGGNNEDFIDDRSNGNSREGGDQQAGRDVDERGIQADGNDDLQQQGEEQQQQQDESGPNEGQDEDSDEDCNREEGTQDREDDDGGDEGEENNDDDDEGSSDEEELEALQEVDEESGEDDDGDGIHHTHQDIPGSLVPDEVILQGEEAKTNPEGDHDSKRKLRTLKTPSSGSFGSLKQQTPTEFTSLGEVDSIGEKSPSIMSVSSCTKTVRNASTQVNLLKYSSSSLSRSDRQSNRMGSSRSNGGSRGGHHNGGGPQHHQMRGSRNGSGHPSSSQGTRAPSVATSQGSISSLPSASKRSSVSSNREPSQASQVSQVPSLMGAGSQPPSEPPSGIQSRKQSLAPGLRATRAAGRGGKVGGRGAKGGKGGKGGGKKGSTGNFESNCIMTTCTLCGNASRKGGHWDLETVKRCPSCCQCCALCRQAMLLAADTRNKVSNKD